jgi:hypothetical protein
MKTTILTITSSDDIYSIQDKLSWNKSGRVLLVLEGKNPLFHSRKELSLLLRSSKNTGSQIGIVTESRVIRTAVKQYGIPVFSSQQEAMRKGWTVKGEGVLSVDEQKRIANIRIIQGYEKGTKKEFPFIFRLGIFFVAVVSVISLMLFFLPGAKVKLNVQSSTQASEIPISASTEISDIDLAGTIPIETKQLHFTLNDQIDCTGSNEVPVLKASGHVLIQNLTDNEIEIPSHTIFSSSISSELRFESTEDAVVPAGVNETIQIPVEALLPGVNGNIEAGIIDAVEGNLGLFLTVSNQESFVGGENRVSSTPIQKDLYRLRMKIRTAFIDLAEEQFTNEALFNEIFIPGSATITETISEQMEPELGQPSEVLKLTQEVVVEGWFIKRTDIEKVLSIVLDSQLPSGMAATQREVIYDSTGMPQITKNNVTWRFVAGREMIQSVNIEEIPNVIAGKSIREAESQLLTLGYAADQFEIKVTPAWWKRLPFLENNIEVEIIE